MTTAQKKRKKESVSKNLYSMYSAYAVIGLGHSRENFDLFCNIFGANTDKETVAEMLLFFAEKMAQIAEEMKAK